MTDLILADLLYMTGLGMTMVFLFLKSRLSRRKTALIFAGTTLLLMALEITLTFAFNVDLVVRLYSLIVYLPSFLIASLLSRYRGWRLLYQFLSAVLFCFLIQHIGAGVLHQTGGLVIGIELHQQIQAGGNIHIPHLAGAGRGGTARQAQGHQGGAGQRQGLCMFHRCSSPFP